MDGMAKALQLVLGWLAAGCCMHLASSGMGSSCKDVLQSPASQSVDLCGCGSQESGW